MKRKETLREALNRIICDGICDKCIDNDDGNCINGLNYMEIREIISLTDDVAHGKWVKSELFQMLKCSNCNKCYLPAEWIGSDKWKFCPQCGAKLEYDTEVDAE